MTLNKLLLPGYNDKFPKIISPSSNINQVIKAVLFFKQKKWEQKVLGPNKLVKVSMYVWTFTNLLGPNEYANLLVTQKQVVNSSVKQTKAKKKKLF